MRIIVLFRDAFRVGETGYRWVVPGIEAAGHEVVALDPLTMAELVGWDGAQRQVLRWVALHRPHLVIVFPPYHYVEPATVRRAQALGARWVALRYDDPIWISFALNGLAATQPTTDSSAARARGQSALLGDNDLWDLTLSTSRQAVRFLQEAGQDVRYGLLPLAVEEYRQTPGRRRPVFSFVGTMQPNSKARLTLVKHLLAHDVPLEVWGTGWAAIGEVTRCWRGTANHGQLLNALGRTLGSISAPSIGGPKPLPMLKLRMLETAAAGGLPIVDPCEEIADYLTPGEEVLTYTDADHLVAVLREILAQPERAAAMAERAMIRTRREHGWGPWLERIAQDLQAIGRPLVDQPPCQDQALKDVVGESVVSLASALEAAGHRAYAAALYRQAAQLMPTDSGALAGLARTSDDDGEQHHAYAAQVRAASPRCFVPPRMTLTDLPTVGLHPAAPGVEALKRFLATGGSGDAALWRQGARILLHLDADRALYCLSQLLEHGDMAEAETMLAAWRRLWGETPAWREVWHRCRTLATRT